MRLANPRYPPLHERIAAALKGKGDEELYRPRYEWSDGGLRAENVMTRELRREAPDWYQTHPAHWYENER